MGQILADTNIFIYLFKNNLQLGQLLDKKTVYISYITELELLSFPKISENEIDAIRELISNCHIIQYSEDLKDDTIFLRKKYSLRIPDAIIAATAFAYFIPLITADKNFRKIKEIDTSIYTG
ncbi:MAG: type II toxin-antitoxin system VapC family toxin [Ginsengibacter sp.]